MARVKLAYPKIPDSKNCPLNQCIAFEKYDGTNLHWVWEPELGWYGFGTRRDHFDLDERGIADFNRSHPGLEAASAVKKNLLFPKGAYTISIWTENQLCPRHIKFFGGRVAQLDRAIAF